MLVGAISAQQVNLAFAFATRARLVRRYGTPVEFDGVTVHAFPAPAALADAPVERAPGDAVLGAEGRVHRRARAGAGRGPARPRRRSPRVPDEAVIARLTAVRGLGRWTAEWFLARGLGRPDVCPADDLGVRRAVEALCFRGRPRDAAPVRRRARAWRPHRSLATHYLLAAHAGPRGAPRPARGRARRLSGARAVPRSLLPLVGADPNRPGAVSLVGRYALGVTWQDRHGSIYPFALLRAACPCGACPPEPDAWPTEIRREAGGSASCWQDGHETLLPYARLRRRCPCARAPRPREGPRRDRARRRAGGSSSSA